jgi:hypothetical protein
MMKLPNGHTTMAHGEMHGVFIPPWDIIVLESIMGAYWDKKLLGETIHGRRRTMDTHINKLLLTDDIFP